MTRVPLRAKDTCISSERRKYAGCAISEVAEFCRLMDGDIIYGGLRGSQDLVLASMRYGTSTRHNNVTVR